MIFSCVKYITFTLHLHYIYITFTLHLHYIYITFTLHLHYIYITFTLHLGTNFDTFSVFACEMHCNTFSEKYVSEPQMLKCFQAKGCNSSWNRLLRLRQSVNIATSWTYLLFCI